MLTVHGIDTGGVVGLVYIQVGVDGPSTPISTTPAAAYVDQVFNMAGYPPGQQVVVGKQWLKKRRLIGSHSIPPLELYL